MVLEQAPDEPGLEISILVGETFGKGDDAPLSGPALSRAMASSPLFGRIRFVPGGSGSDPVAGPNFCALNG